MSKFTNEELVVMIQVGRKDLMPALWERVEKYVCLRAWGFHRKFSGKCHAEGIEIDDLIQEGYIGITKAMETYSVDTGFAFLTYADSKISGQFHRAIKMRCAAKRSGVCVSLEDVGYIIDIAAEDKLRAAEDKLRAAEEDYGRLYAAFDALSPKRKAYVYAYFCLDLTGREIARHSNVTPQTVYQGVRRGLHQMKECLVSVP